MKIVARADCHACKGTAYVHCGDNNTGRSYPCSECSAATALAWLLIRIGSWTSARWDQHVSDEFGDEVTDALRRALRKVPIAEVGALRSNKDGGA